MTAQRNPGSPPSGEVTYKPLQESDFIDVFSCCNETAPMFPDLEQDIAEGRVRGLLAWFHGTCIGAIVGKLDIDATLSRFQPYPLPCLKILFIEVTPSWQGRGIGSSLVERFLAMANEEGIEAVVMQLFKSYKHVIPFMERFGFQKRAIDRNTMLFRRELWSDFGVVDEDLTES